MKEIALITGATSGIGKATAKILTANNFDIIITGRRKDLLLKTEKEIKEETSSKVLSLVFDVRNKVDVDEAIDGLPDEWKKITLLINNAGLASGLEPLNEGNFEDWEKMIDTNVKGLLFVSRKVSNLMIPQKKGRGVYRICQKYQQHVFRPYVEKPGGP